MSCECSDHCCPGHPGSDCTSEGELILYRVDMIDNTGTLFCEPCAQDCLASGLFTDGPVDTVAQDLALPTH